jgi:hypothetical protein
MNLRKLTVKMRSEVRREKEENDEVKLTAELLRIERERGRERTKVE